MIKLYTEEELNATKSTEKLPLQCAQCHKTFYVSKARVQKGLRIDKYANCCSRSCAKTFWSPPVIVQCLECQKMFSKHQVEILRSPRHFCSKSCATRYHNTHKVKGTRVSKLEKWLQSKLPVLNPELEFRFNQTDAINSELDIYIPNLKLAFELNGIFHYEPIYGVDKLSSIQNNDQRKFQACIERGIELCLIDVSKFVNFKEDRALDFLRIIQGVIQLRLD